MTRRTRSSSFGKSKSHKPPRSPRRTGEREAILYALKRFLAAGIDAAVLMVLPYLGWAFLTPRMNDAEPEGLLIFAPFIVLGMSFGGPIVLYGTLIGLTGRTPGKLLTFLKVQDRYGQRPGFAHGILRELVKVVSFSFVCGALYALYGLITCGKTFYDDWLGLDVEDLRPSGLTDVQKNWRKQMREARRG